MTFGERIKQLRTAEKWTIKELVEKLNKREQKASPAYISKIELHNEIPSPEFICILADLFNVNEEELTDCAKEEKVKYFEESLEKKYQSAIGAYRIHKKASKGT